MQIYPLYEEKASTRLCMTENVSDNGHSWDLRIFKYI